MPDANFFAPCPRGLAQALAAELATLGARAPTAAEAGVAFEAPFEFAYTANLHSRIASRVLWRVAQFPYGNEDDVYAGAKAVRWGEHFSAERTFKIDTNAHRSPLKSLDFVTLRVKDAIADAFREALGRRPSVRRASPTARARFLDATIARSLDTRRAALQAGLRDHVGELVKKNLASGILGLAGWNPGMALGSDVRGGTFLSERPRHAGARPAQPQSVRELARSTRRLGAVRETARHRERRAGDLRLGPAWRSLGRAMNLREAASGRCGRS